MRTCQNAYSASPCIEDRRDGRTSSLRDRSCNISETVSGSRSPIAATAPAQNTLPITAASASSDFASGLSVSNRAAISALTDSGNGTSAPSTTPNSPPPHQQLPVLQEPDELFGI